jgi:spore germination protein YaaH
MTVRGLCAALWCVLLIGQSPMAAATPKALGYVAWWMPQSWRTEPLAQFERLLFFDLQVSTEGSITDRHGWPEEWSELRNAAHRSGTPLDLTLTLFDTAVFSSLFASFDNTQRLINEAATLADQPGVAGLQLDFEIYGQTSPQAIENFRTFLRLLSGRLLSMNPPRKLSVFFPVGAEPSLYDSESLRLFDQVVLQGYDVHWPGSNAAGPVAPLRGDDAWNWEKMVAHGRSLGIPAEKLFLGFPLFGYEWPVNEPTLRSTTKAKGTATSFAPIAADSSGELKFNVLERVLEYGTSHDRVSGSSYYHFKRNDGQYIEGWFEDWWTLDQKIDFLIGNRLGGLAFFVIGYDGGHLVDFFMRRRSRDTPTNLTIRPH